MNVEYPKWCVISCYRCCINTHTMTKLGPLKRKDCHPKGNEFGMTFAVIVVCSPCMDILHPTICTTLENTWNKHWALHIFPENYHKHKTWYFIRNPDIDVKKTFDGPVPLTSFVSVTPKNSYISHRYLMQVILFL